MVRKSIGLIFVIALLLFVACKSGDEKTADTSSATYTCPMHPQVINNQPGTCPICAMDLVPVSASGSGNEIMLSAAQIQLANISTQQVKSDVFESSRVLNARVLPQGDNNAVISSKYAGRVDRLFVRETGKVVQKGQPLFQVYSEEIQTVQQEYLLQVKQVAAFPGEKIYRDLLEAAESKLKLLGLSRAQIRQLQSQQRVSPLVTVSSPESGMISEMNILEGQYVAEGTPLMKLENFSALWVEADVYPEEAKGLRLNMPMKVTVNAAEGFDDYVNIDFIAPQVDPSTQVVKIRGTIKNNGSLQPGMRATVLLPAAEKVKGTSLPLDAVVREEAGAHIWIKTGKNTFEPRKVITGEEDASQIIILSGLENVKEVVTAGAYLLTSEFILKKGRNPVAGHHH